MSHVVIQTSTAASPSLNGWLYYYCSTCKPHDSVCAAEFDHGDWFDEEGYSAAFEAFRSRHPHTEALHSHWAQPQEQER